MIVMREPFQNVTSQERKPAMPSVVVTGASTGIGLGTTRVLIEHGLHVFGSVRKAADAERLKATFGEKITPLIFDVIDEPAVHAAAAQVRTALAGSTLLGLVNNAGIAVGGPLLHLPTAEFRTQMEVNLVGPLIVTQAFAPLLGADRSLRGQPGRIVNISSVGGRIGAPFVGAYAASKHGLEGFSESLRRELMLYGIDVIIVGPGAVATPIWDKAESSDASPYDATEYGPLLRRFQAYFIADGRKGLPPERVGATVYEALTAAKPRTRYAVVRRFVADWLLPTLLPRRMVDQAIASRLGLTPKSR
jgi:NAD(P)-dependent dehydrogenase (short-subunit alcohol dehydrogenase family)